MNPKCSCLDVDTGARHHDVFTVDHPSEASLLALFTSALTDGSIVATTPGILAEDALDAVSQDLMFVEDWLTQVPAEADPLNPEIVASVIRRIGERARAAAEVSRRVRAARLLSTEGSAES